MLVLSWLRQPNPSSSRTVARLKPTSRPTVRRTAASASAAVTT